MYMYLHAYVLQTDLIVYVGPLCVRSCSDRVRSVIDIGLIVSFYDGSRSDRILSGPGLIVCFL